MKKKIFYSLVMIFVAISSVAGVNMAMDLKANSDAKVKAGQTCTNCIKVKDLIKTLNLK